jgi:hypothetical protein
MNAIEVVTNEDVNDLIACGEVGRYLFMWSKLFYAIKDRLLLLYAVNDGVDLQIWKDADGYSEFEEWHAEHRHVLARYLLLGHLFHIPTDEFYYFNFEYQAEKHSPGFFDAVCDYKQLIDGKKKYKSSKEAREESWRALKRLIRRHGYLLKEDSRLPLFDLNSKATP